MKLAIEKEKNRKEKEKELRSLIFLYSRWYSRFWFSILRFVFGPYILFIVTFFLNKVQYFNLVKSAHNCVHKICMTILNFNWICRYKYTEFIPIKIQLLVKITKFTEISHAEVHVLATALVRPNLDDFTGSQLFRLLS